MNKLLFFTFIVSISQFAIALECPEFERKVWSGKSEQNKEVLICWSSRSYTVLEKGAATRVFPAMAISYDESILIFLKNLIGEQKVEKFHLTHEALLQEYLEGVGDRATNSMTGSVIGLMDMINNKELMGGFNCDPTKIFLNFDVKKESQMRCVIHTKTLPREVSTKMKSEFNGTGQLPLSSLLADFPDTEILLRSKVHTKEDGSPREIDPREGVPVESYLLYDLIIKLPEGEYTAVGRCYDWQENMFNLANGDLNYDSSPNFFLEGESDPFAARINDSWRIPFGVDVEEGEIRRKNGEKVPSVDVGINSSLIYREEYSGGGSFEFGPTISHPFLQGLSGPSDITDMNNLNLDYRKTTITIGGSIKF